MEIVKELEGVEDEACVFRDFIRGLVQADNHRAVRVNEPDVGEVVKLEKPNSP